MPLSNAIETNEHASPVYLTVGLKKNPIGNCLNKDKFSVHVGE